jgi:hypothetical protein
MSTWRKSSYSDTQGNSCVEVAALSGAVGLRDSKNVAAGHQAVSHEAFAQLVNRIKSRELDF